MCLWLAPQCPAALHGPSSTGGSGGGCPGVSAGIAVCSDGLKFNLTLPGALFKSRVDAVEYSLLVPAGAENDLSNPCTASADTHHRSVDLAAAADREKW